MCTSPLGMCLRSFFLNFLVLPFLSAPAEPVALAIAYVEFPCSGAKSPLRLRRLKRWPKGQLYPRLGLMSSLSISSSGLRCPCADPCGCGHSCECAVRGPAGCGGDGTH